MRLLLSLFVSLLTLPVVAGVLPPQSPLGTQCLDVVSIVECDSEIAEEISDNCRNIADAGPGIYSIQVDPPLSSNPFSHVTLRVGVNRVRRCDRAPFGGLVCEVNPDLVGVFRLHVVESGAFGNFGDCKKDFVIQLPLNSRE